MSPRFAKPDACLGAIATAEASGIAATRRIFKIVVYCILEFVETCLLICALV